MKPAILATAPVDFLSMNCYLERGPLSPRVSVPEFRADEGVRAPARGGFMVPMRVQAWRSKLPSNWSAEHRLGKFLNSSKRAEAVLGAPTARFRGSKCEVLFRRMLAPVERVKASIKTLYFRLAPRFP